MRSSPRRDIGTLLIACVLTLQIAAGCSSPTHHSSAPTTTLLQTDDWKAPQVAGPPSSQNFCTVLVAMYSHQAQLPAATQAVKEQILGDFVATVPEALAFAPPGIEPAARTYLTSLAALLSALRADGLEYAKVPAGTLTPFLLDPGIKAAGNQVLAYSTTVCHYTIGGAPAQP